MTKVKCSGFVGGIEGTSLSKDSKQDTFKVQNMLIKYWSNIRSIH